MSKTGLRNQAAQAWRDLRAIRSQAEKLIELAEFDLQKAKERLTALGRSGFI